LPPNFHQRVVDLEMKLEIRVQKQDEDT